MKTVAVPVIKTEKDYDDALARAAALWGAKPNTPKGDELDVLVTVIEAFEAKHHPIGPPDPIEAIKFRLEQSGLNRSDLIPILGSSPRVSEILNKRRRLTMDMVWKLHTDLNIPTETLVRPYDLLPPGSRLTV